MSPRVATALDARGAYDAGCGDWLPWLRAYAALRDAERTEYWQWQRPAGRGGVTS